MDNKVYIGRNQEYYGILEEEMYPSRAWDYSECMTDSVFVVEVYEVNPEYIDELNWWLECQSMNEYRRKQCVCTYDNRTSEEIFQYLVKHSKLIMDRDGNVIK